MSSYRGLVMTAALCEPLEQVKIIRRNGVGHIVETFYSEHGIWQISDAQKGDIVQFAKTGFVSKSYSGEAALPQIVRLLEDQLIGYQGRLWFHPGEVVTTFIHSSTPFTARLYRHGYEKKCIWQSTLHQPCIQTVPDKYFVEDGLDWEGTLSYKIPDTAQPGIYSLLLENENNETFAIPFVVSTHPKQYGKKTKLLVLASTNNWQSYNIWGGRSRYRNFEENKSVDFIESIKAERCGIRKWLIAHMPELLHIYLKKLMRSWRGTVEESWMFKKLSICRPFTNCRLEESDVFRPFCNHLAAGEWRVLAWLERQGFDYDIVTGYEIHKNPELLEAYDAIILSTHCEYWSAEMYAGLKRYHEQNGLWILNLSGNSIYRQIDFFEDGSTRCVSLSFKDSCSDETQILGVRFSLSDYGTCASYKIMAPKHWVFEGVSTVLTSFGGLSLNQNVPPLDSRYDPGRLGISTGLNGIGASGWETDKISQTAPNDIVVVAKGQNTGGGADMIVREPSKQRGGMFSASSICFGGCLLIDNTASTIVRNVLVKALKMAQTNPAIRS